MRRDANTPGRPDRGAPLTISDPARTVLFTEAHQVDFAAKLWHIDGKGNVCFADGHITFMALPAAPDYKWTPSKT